MGSTTTNRHGVAAFDFATVSGCDQLVVGSTHARGGTLDLLMTDVPDLVRVAVVAPYNSTVSLALLDLDSYGGTDPLGGFPRFLKRTADVMWSVSTACSSG